ncbi:flagellar motor protein MotA [Alkalilimnicola sp. S0819]|nr:flagellar motor protein MotA [Alkalilimnicola sp. S0819]MPQ16006.1 flagellar motor protein MotA [Alkalilimnicola sp. S0819]
MGVFALIVLAVAALLYAPLLSAFQANPVFNGMIVGVLLIGILINFRQVAGLNPEVAWIEEFRRGDAKELAPPERGLLASVARLLPEQPRARAGISTLTLRTLLDGVRNRLDEGRDLSRYLIGLLIFLGLLGTFWGLLETLGSVGQVIAGLNVGGDSVAGLFDQLKNGLQEPLGGMATAFSSSLFGLAGSLVLGFFDLQAGHAQNRFYNGLEEWLAGYMQPGAGPVGLEAGEPMPAYVQALLEQTADALDRLQRALAHGQEERRELDHRLLGLTEEMRAMGEQSRRDHQLLVELARERGQLQPVLEQLAARLGDSDADDEQRRHLRNVDLALARLLEALPGNRELLVDDLRNELRLLARTVAAASGQRLDPAERP